MRFNPADSWRPLQAEQLIAIGHSAFVWFARGRIGSPLNTQVVDAYLDGHGILEARLLGSLPVARFAGPEIARAELIRYLAELAWAPEAMIYNRGLHWRELDASAVEVSAQSEGGTARVRLFFEDGDLIRAEAAGRPRIEGRSTVSRPWIGRFSDYRILNGRRIPLQAEVGWVLDDGFFAAWRGEVSAVESLG